MSTLLDHRGLPLAPAQPQSNVVPLFRDGLAGLVNARTGAGTTIDRSLWDAWMFIPLTPQQLIAGYRSNWLLAKIVDIPAEDMVREWRDWQAADDQIEKLEEAEQRFDLIGKVQQGIAYGRLGGGAILLGYGDADPSSPARENAELQYLHLFNRWELTLGPEITDLASPWFGQPAFYEINGTGQQTRLHPSRVVPFKGAPVPRFPGVMWEDYFWGDSVIQRVDRAVKNAVKASDGFARLIDEAKLDIYRLSGFMQNLISDEAAVRRRVEYTDVGKSSLRGVYLDKEDEFTQRQLSLTGMPEMIETLLSVVAGAADIPATRLLGRAPQGMNATGEHDTLNYNTMIRSKQRLYLSPAVGRIDEALIPTALGSRPAEVHYIWSPLSIPTEKESAEIEAKEAEAVTKYANAGVMPESALAKAVQNRLIESGRWPGIEEALADAEAAGEGLPEDPAELGIVPVNGEGGDPASRRGGGAVNGAPSRRAANDARFLADAPAKTLDVSRKVVNAAEIIRWAKGQGLETTLAASDMHVTVAFSRTPVDWFDVGSDWSGDEDGKLRIRPGGPRSVERLGDGDAVALLFQDDHLQWRHKRIREAGASWDWDEYRPHITLTWNAPAVDVATIEPYTGPIVLGPELFAEVVEDWKETVSEK